MDAVAQKQMPDLRGQWRDDVVTRMRGVMDRGPHRVDLDAPHRRLLGSGNAITLDPAAMSFERQLERLASAVEARVAYERASAMLAATGMETGPMPLWLVAGSSVLARWLVWSRGETAFRKVLAISDQADTAPVVGLFERRARAALGQTAIRIRVSNGLAVGEKIELPAQRRSTMMLGRAAQVSVEAGRLPETVVTALAGRGVDEFAAHPFFAAAGLVIAAARCKGQVLVVDLEHDWGPLAPVPKAAMAVVPADADPACPWRPTQREASRLYALVDSLREHGRDA